MAKRARPGHRALIERALSTEQLSGLRADCAALGVPPDAWPRVPALAAKTETVAVANGAAYLQRVQGIERRPAIETAARKLGLNPHTARSRLERWPHVARLDATCIPHVDDDAA